MQSEHINELATALNKAQSEFSAVPKDSVNPFFKSTYAALPDVVQTATPVLTKYGLSISQFITYDDNIDCLTTYLLHESGQYITHTMRLYLTKSDPQSQGSAVTYARRYSYMSVLGLVADVDDDGNATSSNVANVKRVQEIKAQVKPGAKPANPSPAPTATGDKVAVSKHQIAILDYAETLNQKSNDPNGMLTDILGRAKKWPITGKQLNAAVGVARRIFDANNESYDEVEKRMAHMTDLIKDTFGVTDEPDTYEPF
jgi:hypothetical protein